MATRSRIAVKTDEGYLSIYCHWDGNPEHQMPLLETYYSDMVYARELIGVGNISYLAPKVKPSGKHSFQSPEKDVVVAYGRDRGEKGQEYVKHNTLEELVEDTRNCGGEFLYIFENGKWKNKCTR